MLVCGTKRGSAGGAVASSIVIIVFADNAFAGTVSTTRPDRPVILPPVAPRIAPSFTEIEVVALFPSLEAVIVADPSPVAVTRPPGVTEALDGSDDDQLVTRSTEAPDASLCVAVSRTFAPVT